MDDHQVGSWQNSLKSQWVGVELTLEQKSCPTVKPTAGQITSNSRTNSFYSLFYYDAIFYISHKLPDYHLMLQNRGVNLRLRE
jgi:hypothetical protein